MKLATIGHGTIRLGWMSPIGTLSIVTGTFLMTFGGFLVALLVDTGTTLAAFFTALKPKRGLVPSDADRLDLRVAVEQIINRFVERLFANVERHTHSYPPVHGNGKKGHGKPYPWAIPKHAIEPKKHCLVKEITRQQSEALAVRSRHQ